MQSIKQIVLGAAFGAALFQRARARCGQHAGAGPLEIGFISYGGDATKERGAFYGEQPIGFMKLEMARFRCESITPLGSPVVPEEYRIVARSSAVEQRTGVLDVGDRVVRGHIRDQLSPRTERRRTARPRTGSCTARSSFPKRLANSFLGLSWARGRRPAHRSRRSGGQVAGPLAARASVHGSRRRLERSRDAVLPHGCMDGKPDARVGRSVLVRPRYGWSLRPRERHVAADDRYRRAFPPLVSQRRVERDRDDRLGRRALQPIPRQHRRSVRPGTR